MIEGEQQAGTSMMSSLPPSYEVATYRYEQNDTKVPVDQKKPQPLPSPTLYAPPVHPPSTSRAGSITVYHYVHPVTQERVDTLLPPDHPEMQCLQYGHIPKTRFGIAGILAAIFWFPLGLGCMLIDRDTQCTRCKKILKGRVGPSI